MFLVKKKQISMDLFKKYFFRIEIYFIFFHFLFHNITVKYQKYFPAISKLCQRQKAFITDEKSMRNDGC